MSRNLNLGVTTKVTYSSYDNNTYCPHCWGSSHEAVGALNINGSRREINKCQSCNALYAKESGAIQQLMDEAREIYGSDASIGYESVVTSGTTANANMHNVSYGYNDNEVVIDNNQFNQLNNNLLNMTSSIYTLQQFISDLLRQNKELMDKMTSDPLVNIRSKINEFDLK